MQQDSHCSPYYAPWAFQALAQASSDSKMLPASATNVVPAIPIPLTMPLPTGATAAFTCTPTMLTAAPPPPSTGATTYNNYQQQQQQSSMHPSANGGVAPPPQYYSADIVATAALANYHLQLQQQQQHHQQQQQHQQHHHHQQLTAAAALQSLLLNPALYQFATAAPPPQQPPIPPSTAAVAAAAAQQFLLAQHKQLMASVQMPQMPPTAAATAAQLLPIMTHRHAAKTISAAAAATSSPMSMSMPMKQPLQRLPDGGGGGGGGGGIEATTTTVMTPTRLQLPEKRKLESTTMGTTTEPMFDLKKAKVETKALKAKRPGFTDERYQETSYYMDNGLRKVYPYYFTFTTFTKGRWVGEKILEVFSREFRAHPAEEYERCIEAGTLTVNYEKVPIDYRLKHNDLLANIVHRHEVPVTDQPIAVVHMDEDIVVVNKPASIPVHPCGRYRHNTVVFILAKEFNLKNLRTIHRLDRLTSGLLLFGRSPKKARQMEQQIRNRQVQKEYVCRVEGIFPDGIIECHEPIEVVSYKIGVCKVSTRGKDCKTTFERIGQSDGCSIVLCKPLTGRMHQIRVHLQYLGYPIVNDPLYNHEVFGPVKGRGGDIGGKSDEQLINDLIHIHNAENWLGIDGDGGGSDGVSLFKTLDANDGNHLASTTGRASPVTGSTTTTTPPTVTTDDIEPQKISTPDNLDNKINTTPNGNSNDNGNIEGQTAIGTQTGYEAPDCAFEASKITTDPHCYECKVTYRDPQPQDLIMYLHAWKYKGPGWEYETDLPDWASTDWTESKSES